MNVSEQFSRTAYVYGEQAIEKLNNARVAVFGVGGVGGYAIEALARSGVGKIAIFGKESRPLFLEFRKRLTA